MKTLLRRLLEVPPGWQAAVIVLVVTIPLWTLVAAWETSFMAFWSVPLSWVHFASPVIRIVQHLLLLPPILLCYFLATERRLRMQSVAIEVLRQLFFGAIFSVLVRPALILSMALLSGPKSPLSTAHVFSPLFVSAALQYFLVYFFGLALIWLVNLALDLHRRKLAEERLHSLWLNARLTLLRNQLDPHFFFNCLHTISALIRVDVEKADRMIADVSDLMRYALRENRNEFCTVEQEFDYIRRYIRIEQIRFEDRLGFVLEVSPALMKAQIPSLILQPLVENAIKHGVAAHTGAGAIRLEVAARDSSLVIRIVNSHVSGGANEKRSSMGIGLQHVRERLATIYGAAARLEAGADGRGTWQSVLTLPLQSAAAPPAPAAAPVVPA